MAAPARAAPGASKRAAGRAGAWFAVRAEPAGLGPLPALHAGISFERLARLMSDLFGLEISEGALVNMLADSREAFARAASRIRARLLSGTHPAVRRDQRAGRQAELVDCGSSIMATAPASSSAPAAARTWSKPSWASVRPDFWVSDRLAAQMGWAKKDHQVCLAHLIRDVQYAIDAGDASSHPRLRHLLRPRLRHRPAAANDLADATLRNLCLYRSTPSSTSSCASTPTHAAGIKLQSVIKGSAATSSSSLRTAPFRHQQRLRTRAASLRHLPQDHQLLPHPNGAPSSTPTSAPSSKPHAAEPSAPSTRSV